MRGRKPILLPSVVTLMAMWSSHCGCSILGKTHTALEGCWECTDLSAIGHVSQFAKWEVRFGPDGIFESALVDRTGAKIAEPGEKYNCDCRLLWFDDDKSIVWRYTAGRNRLVLKVEKSINPEDIGQTLTLRRVRRP
jgi:hypothetical protein